MLGNSYRPIFALVSWVTGFKRSTLLTRFRKIPHNVQIINTYGARVDVGRGGEFWVAGAPGRPGIENLLMIVHEHSLLMVLCKFILLV